MIRIRKSDERGHINHGWLDTFHTFSFGDYHDPANMGFRDLRVINDDRVAGGAGFPTHGHRDMEIITYVLDGALMHRDSMGNGGVIHPGEVQRMSAGRGVQHSEANASETEPLHLLQIWILPERAGIQPGYEQKMFPIEERADQLRLMASRDGRNGSVSLHQNVDLYAGVLGRGVEVSHAFGPGRHGWLHVARGEAEVNGTVMRTGDGAAISEEPSVRIVGNEGTEVLLFDLR